MANRLVISNGYSVQTYDNLLWNLMTRFLLCACLCSAHKTLLHNTVLYTSSTLLVAIHRSSTRPSQLVCFCL